MTAEPERVSNIPQEAITAAAEAIAGIHGRRVGSSTAYYNQVARAALEAAAPHILAAEREAARYAGTEGSAS